MMITPAATAAAIAAATARCCLVKQSKCDKAIKPNLKQMNSSKSTNKREHNNKQKEEE